MGLSTAGIAFRATASTPPEDQMLRKAFGERVRPVAASDTKGNPDIRIAGNITVESRDGLVFIYNGDIAESVLFKREPVSPAFLSALGNPQVLLIFCHYDSGGSFGYAIVEDGAQTRFRLHTENETSDEGAPKEFELSWLQAEPVIEEEGEPPVYRNIVTNQIASEGGVTANLLVAAMKNLFGICPWDDWNYKTPFNYYRTEPATASNAPPTNKPWWKLW